MRPLLRFWPDIRARLGTYSLVIVLTLIGNGITLVIPLLTGDIIDGPIAHHDLAGLWAPALAILAVGIAEAAALFGRRMIVAPVASHWEIVWRGRLYDRLQYVSVPTHDAWESGQLLSRATNDMSQMRRFFAFGGPFIVVTPIVILIGTIVLTVMQPVFGLIIALMAVPTIAVIAVFESKYRITSRQSQDTMGEVTTAAEESVQGVRILKAFGREPWMARRFDALAQRLAGLEVRKAKLDSWLWGTILCLPTLAQAAILAVGAWGVLAGWTTIGTVVAAVTITMVLRMPIEMFGFLLSDLLMTMTAAARYWEVMDLPLGITDAGGAIADAPPVRAWRGRVDFDDVDFRFGDAAADTLTGLSLHIEPGRTVALVGATGSGKSALAALIPRLQDITGGAVRLDGTDIRDIPLGELRSLVAVAFEDPILFSATVRENVAIGAPGADDAQVRRALGIAQALEFAEALPEGLDTQVGEQGMALSGGQRQRLALARAIVGTPRVLVLDDPLSAVDVDTEDRVQRELARVLPDSTTLIIAHRPSTAALADEVAVLHEGRIAARGTHHELLRTSALYHDLMGASPTTGPAAAQDSPAPGVAASGAGAMGVAAGLAVEVSEAGAATASGTAARAEAVASSGSVADAGTADQTAAGGTASADGAPGAANPETSAEGAAGAAVPGSREPDGASAPPEEASR